MTNEERAREAADVLCRKLWHDLGVAFQPTDFVQAIILAALNAATAELEEERGRLREALAGIEALRPLSDAATRGPWEGEDGTNLFWQSPAANVVLIGGTSQPNNSEADARLIVAAVNAIRSALAKKDTSNG